MISTLDVNSYRLIYSNKGGGGGPRPHETLIVIALTVVDRFPLDLRQRPIYYLKILIVINRFHLGASICSLRFPQRRWQNIS